MPKPRFLLFIHSIEGALIAAAPIGLMGGVATAAYFDLIIRSCPPGLQGSVLMAATGLSNFDVFAPLTHSCRSAGLSDKP